jgi:5-formyltetrahydrofolate cyclo-ligase
MTDKKRLRKEILEKRDALTERERQSKSGKILEGLIALPEYQMARSVFTYAHYRSEVMTGALMAHIVKSGKRLLASSTLVQERRLALTDILDPVRDLVPSYMGIPEPREEIRQDVPCSQVDLVVTPCVGYDETGYPPHRPGFRGADCTGDTGRVA